MPSKFQMCTAVVVMSRMTACKGRMTAAKADVSYACLRHVSCRRYTLRHL